MDDILNAYQKNSVATVLRTLEEDLRQANTWLDGRQADGILYRQKLSLAPARSRQARLRIAAALAEISALAEKLGLQPEIVNPAGLIRSQMSVDWASLIDSQAGKLRRYGEVHPAAAREIDPHLHHLAQIALELAQLFDSQSSTPAPLDAENLNDP